MNAPTPRQGPVRRRSELKRHLSLVFYKTYADLKAESERTYVGFIWWIIEPLASMLVYYLVFSVILERGGENYVAFLFMGVVPWRWFQTTVMHGSSSIISGRGLMQQVHLPKIVLPVVTLLSDTAKFSVVFLLLLIYVAVAGLPVGAPYLALPLVLAVQFLLVASLTLLTAAVTPFLPDLRFVLQNLIRLWFFLSGVFYDLEIFSEQAQEYLRLNPMAVLLEGYRDIMLDSVWPDLARITVIGALSFLLLLFSIWILRRFDHVYPKLKL